jgi:putative transposase
LKLSDEISSLPRTAIAYNLRQIAVSEVMYYRWRQEFGGLKTEQEKRLKDLELENSRLRKAASDLTLDKLILQEGAPANFQAPRVAVPASSRCEPKLHVSERRASLPAGLWTHVHW